MKVTATKIFTPTSIMILVLILIVIGGILIYLTSCKKQEIPDPKPGENRTSNNKNAPKEITSTDLLTLSLRTVAENDWMSGSSRIKLQAFDEADEHMAKEAGQSLELFKERGYRLEIEAHDFEQEGHAVRATLAVDRKFAIQVAEAIQHSGVIKHNGYFSDTAGLPESAGIFSISATYGTGDKLNYSVNDGIPLFGQNVIQALRPLLMQALYREGHSYLPFLSVYHSLPVPSDMIESIEMHQSHMSFLNTYHFRAIWRDNTCYLSGSCADSDGRYECDNRAIDDVDARSILDTFTSANFRIEVRPKSKTDHDQTEHIVLDETTSSFSVGFLGSNESFIPTLGETTDRDGSFNLLMLFRTLVKKYNEG